ncbi:MAG: hypothetical protein KC468_30255, partial [Myxococcales bacterium]|nr:hypothetical protein [Myxococcales bacterium]
MHLSWIALSTALAGGFLFAAPASSSSSYVQCISECNRAPMSNDDRATCKLNCDDAEKARIRDLQQPAPPSYSHTATPHVTSTPPKTTPEHAAALCRAQCSSEAPSDRPTCELNCKAMASPRPDASAATSGTTSSGTSSG